MVFVPDHRYYYTAEELERLFRTIREGGNFQHYLLFKTLFLTGRRVSEIVGYPRRGILGLRAQDIDFNAGMITFTLEKRGKWDKTGGKKRLIERDRDKFRVPEKVLGLLKIYIEKRELGPGDRIFPASIQYFHKTLKRYLDRAGIQGKKRIIHGLRHSLAIVSLEAIKTAEDLRKLQRALGHKNLTTTEEYLKYKDVNEGELLNQIERMVNT